MHKLFYKVDIENAFTSIFHFVIMKYMYIKHFPKEATIYISMIRVSDWFYIMPNEQFISYINARTSYISMRWWWWCLLCTRPKQLDFIVLAHCNNSPRVDIFLYSYTSWFWTSQPLVTYFLMQYVCA